MTTKQFIEKVKKWWKDKGECPCGGRFYKILYNGRKARKCHDCKNIYDWYDD